MAAANPAIKRVNAPIKNSGILEYFNNNSKHPLFKYGDIVAAILDHAKNKLIYWNAEDGNYSDKTYEITENGKSVYFTESKRRNRESEEKEITFKKLKYDMKISKFTYYTYWVAFALSVAAFIMSLLLLLRP